MQDEVRSSSGFDLQPTLAGALVALRPLVPQDFDALFAVASDPLVWAQHPDKSRSTPDGFRRFFDVAIASGGALLVADRATGQVIGSSRFHGYDPDADEVEIGWTFLARSRWGGRYNGEMKALMLRHAFRFVRHVVFLVAPGNLRSQLALAKIGAVRVADRCDPSGAAVYVFQIDAGDGRFV
ncbi:MAG: GNAT family N-acetyltransferase [Acidobacteria bacterium]|nr:GNAT family N-acetyltransferase [Acidobacteriota bacterium]